MSGFTIDEYRDVNKYLDKFGRYGCAKFTPLIITCAITGGNQGKEANPGLPETLDEQVQQTYDAYNAGASMVHIHRRNPENPAVMCSSAEDYKEVNAAIRAKCPDLIINNTAGGGKIRDSKGNTTPAFLTSIPAAPEVASIDVTNYAWRDVLKKREAPLFGRDEDLIREGAYGLTPTEASECLKLMKQYGCKPEFECFDIGDLNYLKGFLASGEEAVNERHLVQMVFNGLNFQTIDYMSMAMRCLPENCVFGTIAVGAAQWGLLAASIVMGGHVRVGMEDNIYLGKGRLAKNNAELVEKIVRIATELGRPIATPAQAREILGLGEPRQYTYSK